jgi:hypothetical protein
MGIVWAQPSITVTSPNGGETWSGSSTQNITWTVNTIPSVDIEFSTNNGSTWNTIVTSYSGLSSPFPWQVPSAGPLGSTQCLVRIKSTTNNSISDVSNATFSIPASTVTLNYPTGGEVFKAGQMRSIRWTPVSVVDVRLEYTTNNGSSWTLINDSIPANRGFFSWIVPNIVTSSLKVRVSDRTFSTVNSVSPTNLSVSAALQPASGKYLGGPYDGYTKDNNLPKVLTVTAPNGGENWAGATTQNINWSSQNVDNVRIEYSTNNGSSWIIIQNSYPAGTGTYPWLVPSAGPLGSSVCLVKLTNTSDVSINDASNANFSIPASSVGIIYPNGGENLKAGSLRSIRWNSASVLALRLEYSTNNGTSWSLINDSIPAWRTYFGWTIPTNALSVNCKVRLRDRTDTTVQSISAQVFTISGQLQPASGKYIGGPYDGYTSDNNLPRTVVMTSPNGGENWSGASTQNLTWNALNIPNIKLEYTTNNGSNWVTIINPYPASTGTYPWLVPGAGPLGSTTCRVRITDVQDSTRFDESNSNFTIPPSSVAVVRPNGGEALKAGMLSSIRWNSASILNVQIHYSTNNGSAWTLMIDSVPAWRNFYGWTIPNNAISPNCLVRIRDKSDTTVSDVSNAVFAIGSPLSPASGKFLGGAYDGYSNDVACPIPVATISGLTSVCNGQANQLSVRLQNSPPWTFQWTDGVSTQTINNQSNSVYVINLTPTASRTYQVTTLQGNCGNGVASNAFTQTVTNLPTAALSGTQSICNGNAAQVSVTLTGTAPWSLTYTASGQSSVNVSATASPYVITSTPVGNVTYSLNTITDACATGNVNGTHVIQNITRPTVVLTGNNTINNGTSTNLSFSLTGPSPWSLTYSNGTTNTTVTGLTNSPYVVTVSPTSNTTYTATAVSSSCTGTASGSAAIQVNTQAVAVISGTQTVCAGTSATLTVALSGPGPYNLVWTNGSSQFTVNGLTSSAYLFSVTPAQNTTYSLVSVSNILPGLASGQAMVSLLQIPAAPSGLSASAPTCSGVTLNWTAVSGATQYFLDVANDSLFTSFLGGYQNQNVGNATQVNLTGLNIGQTVYFRVRSVGICGVSNYSLRGMASTVSLPGVVQTSSPVQVTCSSFDASWASVVGATAYRLDVALDTAFTQYVPNFQNVATGNTTSYSVTGLTAGQQHYYRVRGENTCGVGSNGSRTRIVTYRLPDSIAISGSPVVCINNSLVLSATSSIFGVNMQWTGPSGYQQLLNQNNLSRNNLQLNQAGVYSLTVTSSGCANAVITRTVIVNQPVVSIAIGGNTTLCAGEVLQLTSTGGVLGNVYSWTGPNNFTSSIANPQITSVQTIAGGRYSLTVTSQGCNSITDTLLVSVIPTQAITVTNNTPLCSGSTVYFQATWYNGSQYNWTGPNGYSATGTTPFLLYAQPTDAGIYTLSVIQSGCQTALIYPTTVSVSDPLTNLNPINNSPVCQGDTASVLLTQLTGVTYNWVGPNGFTSNQPSLVIPNGQPSQSGLYTVTGNSPGCGYYMDVHTVTINPTPGVSASVSQVNICQGDNVTFTSGGNNQFALYRWRGPNSFVATASTTSLSYVQLNQAGVYTIEQTVPGCSVRTDTVEIWVSPNIQQQVLAGTSTPVCTGNTLSLTATQLSGVSYFWQGPGGFTANTASTSRTNANAGFAGIYTLTASAGGCANYVQTFAVTVSNISVASASSNSPVCGGFNLSLVGTGPRNSRFNWTGPNGYSANTATAIIPGAQTNQSGIYSLAITVPSCGVVSFTTAVQIGSNLNNSYATANLPVCIGNTLRLSATQYSDATYAWTGPNSFTSTNPLDSILSVTSAANGNYAVVISTPGCLPITQSVSVSLLPVLVATATANTPVCQGNNLYLSGGALNGVNMQWAGPNGYSNTGTTPSITNVQPAQSGIYTLTASRTGCGIYTTSVNVLVGGNSSGVTLTSNSPVCVGQTLRLTSSPIANATYAWQGPNGFTGSNQVDSIPTVAYTDRGQYTLTVNSPGCVSISRISRIVVDTVPTLSASSNSPVCQGGTLLLSTAWPLNSGIVWLGPNGYTSTLRTPSFVNSQTNLSGIYTINVSGNCGISSSTVAVAVNPGFGNLLLGTNSPVCNGQTLRLTSSSLTNAAYTWRGPNGFSSATNNDSIVNVTAPARGEYSLTVVIPGCGTSNRFISVTVDTIPVLSPSSNTPVCQGNTLQLSTRWTLNSGVVWTGPNGFNTTLRTPTITNTQTINAGVYTISVTMNCGVIQATHTVVVGSASSSVVIGNSSSNGVVCAGGVLRLSASPVLSGHTYYWTGPLGFTSSASSDSVTNMQTNKAGFYYVTITSPGCGNRMISSPQIRINNPASLIASGNTPVCIGANLNLQAPVLTGTGAYAWSGPGGFAFNGRTASRFNIQSGDAGVYTVTASMPACGTISSTVTIATVNCRTTENTESAQDSIGITGDPAVSVESLTGNGEIMLTAWPNPNEGSEITVKWMGLSPKDPTISVKIYDAVGKLISVQSVKRNTLQTEWVETLKFPTNLSKGQYLLESIYLGERQYLNIIVK